MMDVSTLIRREVKELPVYEPGKPAELVAREKGLDPHAIIKLASNENPLGAPPVARKRISELALNPALYPDNSGWELTAELARRHQVDRACITLAAGSNEIFYLLCDIFGGNGTEVMVGEHAFVSYRIAAMLSGSSVVSVPMPGLTHDLEAMRRAVTPRTRLVFLPNPNNPTGTMLPAAAVADFALSLPKHVIFCYDSAYAEYEQEEPLDCARLRGEGVAVVEARTFSKIYGLAGLRIGYAVAEANISRLLNRVRPPFNTSSIAQAAALAALQDTAWVDASAQANRFGRAQLLEGLKQLGWKASGQHANFILLHTADGAALTERLAQAGIIVRDLAGYRLPQLVRVSIGTTEQNRRFLEAMRGLSPSPLMDVA